MAQPVVETPKGTKDFLPKDARRKRWLEETLLGLFARWNYQEIVTPTMEYHDVISAGGATGLGDHLYRFFEREGGLITLRPDATTPVARMVATRLRGEPKPLRLCYNANVFRYAEPHAERRREFYQAGVELVGTSHYLSDVEIIALAVEALQAVGLRDFRVDIGHVDYCGGLLQHSSLGEEIKGHIRNALLRKDYVALRECVGDSRLPRASGELLMMLPELRGDRAILAKAQAKATNPTSQRAVQDLGAIYDALSSYGLEQWIQVDLGMVKDLQYYTGMVLEAYTADLGFTIGTGGRYDNLIDQFGYQCPATGFALGVERLMLALSRQGGWMETLPAAVLCASSPDDLSQAWQLAQTLRQAGHRVELDLDTPAPAALAASARARGFAWAVLPLTKGQTRFWREDLGWQSGDLSTLLACMEGGEGRE